MTRFLVVGCGNEMAGDDSAGIEFVKRLRARGPAPDTLELSYSGLELLDLFDRADLILFVDAVVSGAAPGTLHVAELPCAGLESRSLDRLSTHGWDLPEVLQLAHALHRRVPRVVLLGIEAGSINRGTGCSRAVLDGIEQALDHYSEFREYLLAWQESPAPLDWSFPHPWRALPDGRASVVR